MAQFITLFILLWMANSFIDWLVGYVTIIWIIFLSMSVAHAKSGSTISRNSGLTPGLFGIMFCGVWWMFCLCFLVVEFTFLVTVKSSVNFFGFNVIKIDHAIVDFVKRYRDTWHSIFFVSHIFLQQVYQLLHHYHHFFHLQMSRLHLRSLKVYHLVLHTKSRAVHYHQHLVRKHFHQNHFLHQNSFTKIELLLVKKFFLIFLFHCLSCNLK